MLTSTMYHLSDFYFLTHMYTRIYTETVFFFSGSSRELALSKHRGTDLCFLSYATLANRKREPKHKLLFLCFER